MARGFLKGIFTGGLIGYVLGVLFAPQKGEETRQRLSKISDDLSSTVKDISETIKKKSTEISGKFKSPGEEF